MGPRRGRRASRTSTRTAGRFPTRPGKSAAAPHFRPPTAPPAPSPGGGTATTARPSPLRDVNPSGSSVPANLRNVQGRLFFTADDGVHGDELWASDGTTDGTAMVADLNPSGGSYPHAIVNVGGVLYLAADDGTSGTQLWT